MSDVRTDSGVPTRAPAASPQPEGPEPRLRPGAREMALRFLTLREGSIIVVTLLAALYFTVKTDRFFSHANFVTLLPYFAPFAILAAGEVALWGGGGGGAPDGGGRDRPVDRVGLPVRAVHVLRVQPGRHRARRLPDPGAPVLRRGRRRQRHLHRGHRRVVVHHDARHAARARRLDAHHLPCSAGRDAGRRGDDEDGQR